MKPLLLFPLWRPDAENQKVIELTHPITFDDPPSELPERARATRLAEETTFTRCDELGGRVTLLPPLGGTHEFSLIKSSELHAFVPKSPGSQRDRATWAFIQAIPPEISIVVYWHS